MTESRAQTMGREAARHESVERLDAKMAMMVAKIEFLEIRAQSTDSGNQFAMFLEAFTEFKKLKETRGIIDYHSKFQVISSRITLPEHYLVRKYLAGLNTDTQRNVRIFNPQTVRQCFAIADLYEWAYPNRSSDSVVVVAESSDVEIGTRHNGIPDEIHEEVEEIIGLSEEVLGDNVVESEEGETDPLPPGVGSSPDLERLGPIDSVLGFLASLPEEELNAIDCGEMKAKEDTKDPILEELESVLTSGIGKESDSDSFTASESLERILEKLATADKLQKVTDGPSSIYYLVPMLLQKDGGVNQNVKFDLKKSVDVTYMFSISCTSAARQIALAKLFHLNDVSRVSRNEIFRLHLVSSDFEVGNVVLWVKKPPPRPPDSSIAVIESRFTNIIKECKLNMAEGYEDADGDVVISDIFTKDYLGLNLMKSTELVDVVRLKLRRGVDYFGHNSTNIVSEITLKLTRRREFLNLGGLVVADLSTLLWMNLCSAIFGGSMVLFKIEIYLGLMVFVEYAVVDRREIIGKTHLGNLVDYMKSDAMKASAEEGGEATSDEAVLLTMSTVTEVFDAYIIVSFANAGGSRARIVERRDNALFAVDLSINQTPFCVNELGRVKLGEAENSLGLELQLLFCYYLVVWATTRSCLQYCVLDRGRSWGERVSNGGFEASNSNTLTEIQPWSFIENDSSLIVSTDRSSYFTCNSHSQIFSEAITLLALWTSGVVDFVRHGAFITKVMAQVPEARVTKVGSFMKHLEKIILDNQEDTVSKIRSILKSRIVDVRGWNVTIKLLSRTKHDQITVVVDLAVFIQHGCYLLIYLVSFGRISTEQNDLSKKLDMFMYAWNEFLQLGEGKGKSVLFSIENLVTPFAGVKHLQALYDLVAVMALFSQARPPEVDNLVGKVFRKGRICYSKWARQIIWIGVPADILLLHCCLGSCY